jgi:hypothetical protein
MDPLVKAQLDLISSQLDNTGRPRLLLILPASAGDIFLATALLCNLKEAYPRYDLYFACNKEFFDILKNNPYIHKTIEYSQIMMMQVLMEGTGAWPGIFDISIFISAYTQLYTNYLNNGKTNVTLKLRRQKNASN